MKNKQLEKQLNFKIDEELYSEGLYETTFVKGVSLQAIAIRYVQEDLQSFFSDFNSDIYHFFDLENPSYVLDLDFLGEYIKILYMDLVKEEEEMSRCNDILAELLNTLVARIYPVLVKDDCDEFAIFQSQLKDLELQKWTVFLGMATSAAIENSKEYAEISIEQFKIFSKCFDNMFVKDINDIEDLEEETQLITMFDR